MTIPPSPVHPARPRPAWTWILSNHSQNPPLAGSVYRARTTEDTGTSRRLCRLRCPGPTLRAAVEPRGPFLRGAGWWGWWCRVVPGTVSGRTRGVPRGYTPGHAPTRYPVLPCTPTTATAHRAGTGLWAQRRRGVPALKGRHPTGYSSLQEAGEAGSREAGSREQGAGMQEAGSREAGSREAG